MSSLAAQSVSRVNKSGLATKGARQVKQLERVRAEIERAPFTHAAQEESTVGDYFALLKPRVMSLVVFSGFAGLYAAPGELHPFLAAVAVPKFLAFLSRARKSEARTTLTGIYNAEEAYMAEYEWYGGTGAADTFTLWRIGFSPAGAIDIFNTIGGTTQLTCAPGSGTRRSSRCSCWTRRRPDVRWCGRRPSSG
jgi:Tfp pilus assembly protein PilE